MNFSSSFIKSILIAKDYRAIPSDESKINNLNKVKLVEYNVDKPWEIINIADKILNSQSSFIHPSVSIEDDVIIDGNVSIGKSVKIKSGARISGNIYIGDRTFIGNNAIIRGNTSIGVNSILGHNAHIKSVIASKKFQAASDCFIADSIIGENCFFGGALRTSNYRLDGKEIKLAINNRFISSGKKHFGTIVGDNSTLGINVTIMPGRIIGNNCIIGPMVLLTKNLPAYTNLILEQSLLVSNNKV